MPQAALFHYWHPQRFGVTEAPEDFQARLHEIHPRLRVVHSPVHKRWLVWHQDPTVTHNLCPGWKLVLIWMAAGTGGYLPLDNRLLANLYERDPRRYRSAVHYFDDIVTRNAKANERIHAAREADKQDRIDDWQQYKRPKNIGSGSKAALFGDGSIVPSQGERNWLRERGGLRGDKSARA